jgi:D-glycero-alpha-D-manno-heptose-7-phosphate kinase
MFLVSRTPLRVSLFGGGSDYPEWFHRRPGAVLGFTIDKHVYISALQLTTFVDHRFRFSYHQVETADAVADILHPVVRAVLDREAIEAPLDISVQADLPANSGLGTSSAFTVGFVNLISAIKETTRTKLELAELAIDIEQNVLQERVGIQDQLHTALGGLNHFRFEGDKFDIDPIHVRGEDLDRLTDWMVLVYTGIKRHASGILDQQIKNTAAQKVDAELDAMVDLVSEGHRIFENRQGDALPLELARLLQEGWRLKKRLSPQISSPDIDVLYDRCRALGAVAGKLCGAGSGGFLLIIIPPDRRAAFCEALGPERCISFRIEHTGSVVSRQW